MGERELNLSVAAAADVVVANEESEDGASYEVPLKTKVTRFSLSLSLCLPLSPAFCRSLVQAFLDDIADMGCLLV